MPHTKGFNQGTKTSFFTSVCHLLLYSFLHHFFYLTILHLPLYSSLYSLFFSCSFFPCYLDTLLCCLQIAFIFTFLCRNTYSLCPRLMRNFPTSASPYVGLPLSLSLSELPHLRLVCVSLTCLLTVYFFFFFLCFLHCSVVIVVLVACIPLQACRVPSFLSVSFVTLVKVNLVTVVFGLALF